MSRSVGLSLSAGILGRTEWNTAALTGKRAGRIEAVGLEATDLDGVGEKATWGAVREDRTTGIKDAGQIDERAFAAAKLIHGSGAEKNPELYQFGGTVSVFAMHIDVPFAAFPLSCGDVGPFHQHYGRWSGQSTNSGESVKHG